DAAVRTVETAGSAVITSGLTVVVGFAALLTTPLSDTRSVGVGGLFVVLVAVLLATTFLPAVLAVLGRNIDRPKWLARPLAKFHAPTGWERWARWLGHRPWRAVAAGGIAIALLAFPATQIRLGLPATNWFPPESESGQGLAALRAMGASGVIQPIRVVVHRGVRGLGGAEILVGGFAASNVDTQHELLRRFPETMGLVLGITAIMLFAAFRSVLVPLKAVLLNCLSVGAAFGLTVLVFQHGYGGRLFGLEGPTEAIWAVVPVLVFAIV